MACSDAEKSPEVLCVRNAMDETGVDFAMDIHGDEAIPANFLAGFEGIPSITDRQKELFSLFSDTLERVSPDFQTRQGYEIPAPGQANLSMSTTQLAERFGCVSMTLEMPFKDNFDLPDPVQGWSPARSKFLAHACLDALHSVLPELGTGQELMPTLVLLRHGQSQWNLENRFTGWWDVDLSDKGIAEARAAGRMLKAQGRSNSTAASPASRPARSARSIWCCTKWTAVAAGGQGLAPQRAPLWRADRASTSRR